MNNLSKFYKGKRILITGHTGFKGSWLTQILLNWGAQISGIALKPNTKPSLFQTLELERKIRNNFCDIRDFKKISKIIKKEKPEIIFHLAAQPLVRDSYDDPLYTFETNVIGTTNILQTIKESNTVKAAVIITTDKVYENKENGIPFKEDDKLGGYDPYSASKAAAEILIDSYIKSFFNPTDYNKKHKTLIASARAGNIIGGGDWQKDRLVPDLIRAIFEKKKEMIIRNPDAIRPWQFVLEVLYGYLLLARQLYEGKREFSGAWNFGPSSKNYVTVEELIRIAFKILKKGSYKIKRDLNKHEVRVLKLDSSKSKEILGWQSLLSIKTVLELTLDWYQAYYKGENVLELSNQQIEVFSTLWHKIKEKKF